MSFLPHTRPTPQLSTELSSSLASQRKYTPSHVTTPSQSLGAVGNQSTGISEGCVETVHVQTGRTCGKILVDVGLVSERTEVGRKGLVVRRENGRGPRRCRSGRNLSTGRGISPVYPVAFFR
jgi:hypothetical protein